MPTAYEAYDPEVKPPFDLVAFPSGRFPRLRRRESLVLDAYLEETGRDTVDRLRTAVPVGEGEVDGVPANRYEEQKKALSQWKVDAVIDRPGHQEIIELKSRATHTALGQVLAYDLTLGERSDEPTESRRLVVGFRLHPDLARVARILGIQPHTVPQADRSTATHRFLQDVDLLQDDES